MNGVLNGTPKRAPLTRRKRSVSMIARMSTSATDLDPVALVEDQAAVAMSVQNDSVELRRCWHPIARSTEVSELPRRFWLLGEPLVGYRAAGEAVILSDRCPHRRAPLSKGAVMDGTIQCAYHGWRFDATGSCVEIPSLPPGPLARGARVVAPQVVERDGLVFVALDEPIIDVPEFAQYESATQRVVHLEPYSGRYSAALLIDNQLDLTHFAFVHKSTFGTPEAKRTPRYEIERDSWGFRIDAEIPISASNDPAALEGRHPLLQHRLMRYRYVAPFFVEITLSYPVMGGSTVVMFFAQPEQAAQPRLVVTLSFMHPDGFTLEDLAERVAFERRVIGEDLELQSSFDVMDLPLDASAECHVRAERASVEYRRILTSLFTAAQIGGADVN